MQIRLLGIMLVLWLLGTSASTQAQTSPCANGKESGLPLPSSFLPAKLPEFQTQLKSFLTSGKYQRPEIGVKTRNFAILVHSSTTSATAFIRLSKSITRLP